LLATTIPVDEVKDEQHIEDVLKNLEIRIMEIISD
jgi:hypothetical protein